MGCCKNERIKKYESSRDVIRQGTEFLGWELDTLFEKTILAMRESEDKIEEEMKNSN